MSLLSRMAALASRVNYREVLRDPEMLQRMKNVSLMCSRSFSVSPTLAGTTRKFVVHPSKFVYRRFKNHLHFYVTLAFLIYGVPITYLTVKQGPAELVETPPGYNPKEWECYKHPATRWLARYIVPSEQSKYEKMLATLAIEQEKMWYRKRDGRMRELEKERKDYFGYFTKEFRIMPYFEYLYDFHNELDQENKDPFFDTSNIRSN